MEKILRGVRKFHDEIFPAHRQLFEKIAKEQRPRALFITCSDSRVHPNLITQTEPGDLFILRNPGNIIPAYHAGNDSEAATIEYAVGVLDVEDIIVCGHSNCGAMSALLNNGKANGLPAVSRWLHHAESTRRIIDVTTVDRPPEERIEGLIRQNVLVQLDHLRTHPSVASRLAQGGLRLHGWVYDIGSGDVSVHDQDRRKFVSLTRNGSAARSQHA
ncbi:MAG TPA: carbonic anhydrase [Phycisphaerae bacterium]|nr:carbonic anhydrase [Phycisphaerae bacterium]